MKKSFLAIIVAFAQLLFVSSVGMAQFSIPNQVGLNMTPDGTGAMGTSQIGAPVNVFLVLTKPEDSDGSPYAGISAFDCQLNFNPAGGIFLTGEAFPAGGVNSGDTDHLADGFLDYTVGYSNDVPVVDEAVMLVQLQFINSNIETIEVTLGPVSTPSIPGGMSYLPSSGLWEIMEPNNWCEGCGVFFFGHPPQAVEYNSFGSVKALFR